MLLIIDNNAVSALRKLEAEGRTPSSLQGGGLQMATTYSLLHELFHPLPENPFHPGATQDAAFYLKHWPFVMLEDIKDGVMREVCEGSNQHLESQDERLEAIVLRLREAAKGQFDPELAQFRDRNDAFRERATQSFEALVDQVMVDQPRPAARDFEGFGSSDERINSGAGVLMQSMESYGLPLTEAEAIKISASSWDDPKNAPYVAGLIRVSLFNNWHSRYYGSTSGEQDVKHISFAASCDGMLSADKQLLKRGHEIFPELSWINVRDL